MRRLAVLVGLPVAAIVLFALAERRAFTTVAGAGVAGESTSFTHEELRDFSYLNPIDTHTHIYKDDPAYTSMLQKLHLHILDIVDVSDNGDPERKSLDKEERDVFAVARDSHDRAAVCTSFDPFRINDPNFGSAAIARLNESFSRGAIAVKLWKNIGMEIKDTHGNYVLPDQPVLEPVYRDIAARHKTLLTHVADPDTAWEHLGNQPDARYYSEHPEWYLQTIQGAPTKADILLARDHVLEENSDLRVVGAHLGSMESNLNQIAQHLDEHPNFAVDLAGRIPYLTALPREVAVAFITKYQDRILYGTDDTIYPQDDVNRAVAQMDWSYAEDWRYFATGKTLTYHHRTVEGLGLSKSVLRRIYHDNAVHWFPGILKN
ncbi:MAG TPA: amidohydrolase family protein [Acidobacteriaceae bacterium]|jgi:predicted TIM-barrel fold metal-dependent hydrolase